MSRKSLQVGATEPGRRHHRWRHHRCGHRLLPRVRHGFQRAHRRARTGSELCTRRDRVVGELDPAAVLIARERALLAIRHRVPAHGRRRARARRHASRHRPRGTHLPLSRDGRGSRGARGKRRSTTVAGRRGRARRLRPHCSAAIRGSTSRTSPAAPGRAAAKAGSTRTRCCRRCATRDVRSVSTTGRHASPGSREVTARRSLPRCSPTAANSRPRWFVCAAGTRTPDLLRPLGLELPIAARKRTVFVFDSPARLGAAPLVIDPSGLWFRPEGAAYLCGVPPQPDPDVDAGDFAGGRHRVRTARLAAARRAGAGVRGRPLHSRVGRPLRLQHVRSERLHRRRSDRGQPADRERVQRSRTAAGTGRRTRSVRMDRARPVPLARSRAAGLPALPRAPAARRNQCDL